MKKFNFILSAVALNLTTSVIAGDYLAPSQSPPANIPAEFVPQFVTLGFDDNNEAIGIEWTLQTFAQLHNHPGVGEQANFDGQTAKASFFPTCSQADNNPAIVASWRNIWTEGHEVGNHTYDHAWGQNFDQGQWESQMQACMQKLSAPWRADDVNAGSGIPRQQIQGFRAPFVVYNDDTFKAMKSVGLSYDVSIQEGLQSEQHTGNYYWPYTLDEGSPGSQMAWWGPHVTSHPGVWALPLHVLQVIPDDKTHDYGLDYSLLDTIHETLKKVNFKGNKLTAFDFNLYANDDWMFSLTKAEALAVFKYNLDQRIQGNRAPLVLGFHTDYLNGQPMANMTATTAQERRDVVEQFLTYAVSKKQVRVVRHIDVINWMRNPTRLVMCTQNQWDFQAVYTKGDRVTFQGHLWTAKWWNRLETPLPRDWSVWQDEGRCVSH